MILACIERFEPMLFDVKKLFLFDELKFDMLKLILIMLSLL